MAKGTGLKVCDLFGEGAPFVSENMMSAFPWSAV
jgi:hypothetical protein